MGRRSARRPATADARSTVRAFGTGAGGPEADAKAVLAMHNRAFEGHPDRSERHWRWKFLENPVGEPQITLAMATDGTCAAAYSVVPHRIVLNGEEARAGLQTDMAVDPSRRRGLGGSRLIVELGRLYVETYVLGRTQLEWGFPEPQLQRVCIKHLGVGVLRDLVFLARATGAPPSASAELEVRTCARAPADTGELWTRTAKTLEAATIRDAAYLDWRYTDHPDVAYTIVEARERGAGAALRGVAVVREGGWDECLFSVMDWLVPGGDVEAELALLHWIESEAARRGKSHVVAWFPTPSKPFHRFQVDYGYFAKGTPYQESYRSWVPDLGRRWLDEHWFQTLGDLEFF